MKARNLLNLTTCLALLVFSASGLPLAPRQTTEQHLDKHIQV